MLGDFITRCLILFLGYAFPAFECFKIIEKNRVEIEELRYWCQYWVIVAILTVLERIGDIFVSWVPMYGEVKLALFIYLWYPKTKGTGYIYDTLLKPYVVKHETDIDRSLREWRARAWDIAIYYWQNCTELGEEKFFQLLQYLASFRARATNPSAHGEDSDEPPPATPTRTSIFKRNKQQSDKRRPPPPPPSAPPAAYRSVSQTPKSETVKVHVNSQTQFVHSEDPTGADPINGHGSTENGMNHSLHAARLKLRRSRGIN